MGLVNWVTFDTLRYCQWLALAASIRTTNPDQWDLSQADLSWNIPFEFGSYQNTLLALRFAFQFEGVIGFTSANTVRWTHWSITQIFTCFPWNQVVSSCNRISWLFIFKVTYCHRFMPSVSYIELTTLWNFKGVFPLTVAVVFCDDIIWKKIRNTWWWLLSNNDKVKYKRRKKWFLFRE